MTFFYRIFQYIVFPLGLLAMASTFSFTTQDYMDGISGSLATQFEVEAHDVEEEDDSFPQPNLVEEELMHPPMFQHLMVSFRELFHSFPRHINLLPQFGPQGLLRPPSL